MARRVTSSASSRGGLVLFRGPAGDYHGSREGLLPFPPLSGQFDPLKEHGRSYNLLSAETLALECMSRRESANRRSA